ncbi:MAG TPA: NADH-quinone oxidoreductase subunit M [Candidatus Aminicenantes bacterium]|nr:NADH-quinone oxidoreductase subunit M [Candidatus Aminicenantes bacterium]
MTLLVLLSLPLLGVATLVALGPRRDRLARWVSLAALLLDLAWLLAAWGRQGHFSRYGEWRVECLVPWIPSFGASLHLMLDGLGLVMLLLALGLGLVAVLASWREIERRAAFFHGNLLACLAGILGVFLARDLFLFYTCWELMLIPMYFMIGVHGHENRRAAATKFFLFTQAGGLLMLLSIVGVWLCHGQQTGVYTFDLPALLGTALPAGVAPWLMGGMLAGFLVKLPAFPLHVWLPDAHTEAPTGGSVILAGLLLKTGAYGLLRICFPLFPQTVPLLRPLLVALAIGGILYGALRAMAQDDFKRLVAYSSVSHLGYVLLALAVWRPMALAGAVVQMVAHGLSTGALFLLAGALDRRLHTRRLERMGGLWDAVPRLAGAVLFFSLASLGLPGLANFSGEALILFGGFDAYPLAVVLGAAGLVLAAVYSLRLVQRALHGPAGQEWHLADLDGREGGALLLLGAASLWIGLYPAPFLRVIEPALARLIQSGGTL